MRHSLLALLMALGLVGAAQAQEDPVLEKRFVRLTEHLRCLVCQNQSIAESHAELAMDLKRQVREMLLAGRSDSEISDYMVQRYGDFVLYEPPFKASTLLLWAGPATLLLGGLGAFAWTLRRRAAQAAGLDEAQRAAARALLDGETPDKQENKA